MKKITTFNFNNAQVRVIIKDNDPWFFANEICAILNIANPRDAVSRLDEDEKGVGITDTLRGKQKSTIISEAGLYRLTLTSDKAQAKVLQRWVTHDVLPSIRKTGAYANPSAKNGVPEIKPITVAARLLPTLIKAAKSIGCDNNAAVISASQAVKRLTDVDLLETLGQTHLIAQKQENFYTPTELGKELNINARQVNLLLAEAGMQLKRGEVWEATEAGKEFARIYDTGKKHGSGVPITQIKWSINVLQLLNKEKEVA